MGSVNYSWFYTISIGNPWIPVGGNSSTLFTSFSHSEPGAQRFRVKVEVTSAGEFASRATDVWVNPPDTGEECFVFRPGNR